jgi:hypothetical protein
LSVAEAPGGSSFRKMPTVGGIGQVKTRLPVPVFLYLLAVMLPIGFNLGPLYMTGVRLILIIMIVPLTFQMLAGKYGRRLPTDIFFLLHFAWIVVALLMNNPDRAIQNAGSSGVEFLGGYVLARAYIRTKEDFISLIKALVVSCMLTLPFAIYETLTGQAIILKTLSKLPGVGSLRDLAIGQRMGLNRVQMSFVHPIHWGLYCSMVLSLCFIGMQGVYSAPKRTLATILVGMSGLLALSSGALLAIVLQIFIIFWAWAFQNTSARWTILYILGAFLYVVIDLLSNRSPLMVFLSYATFSPHTAYWRTIIFDYGMDNVWANPMFGIGLNDWVRPAWMHSGSVDNFWLVQAMTYGIPGFGFIAAGYIMPLWKIGRLKLDSDKIMWNLRRAWMFSFIGLTFTLSTVHVWHTIYSLVFFMFGAGMWMLYTQPDDGEGSQSDDAQAEQTSPEVTYTRFPQTISRR